MHIFRVVLDIFNNHFNSYVVKVCLFSFFILLFILYDSGKIAKQDTLFLLFRGEGSWESGEGARHKD